MCLVKLCKIQDPITYLQIDHLMHRGP